MWSPVYLLTVPVIPVDACSQDDMRPEEDDLKETGKKRKRQRKDGQVDYVFGVSAEELDKVRKDTAMHGWSP